MLHLSDDHEHTKLNAKNIDRHFFQEFKVRYQISESKLVCVFLFTWCEASRSMDDNWPFFPEDLSNRAL